jgi:hypothetical protein
MEDETNEKPDERSPESENEESSTEEDEGFSEPQDVVIGS